LGVFLLDILTSHKQKTQQLSWVFWYDLKLLAYKEIELEVFCLLLSWSSIQPVKPTIINAIAKIAKVFFIVSSNGVKLFLCARYEKHG